MIKKSRQKFEGLENEKSFLNEIKSSARHFERAFTESDFKSFAKSYIFF